MLGAYYLYTSLEKPHRSLFLTLGFRLPVLAVASGLPLSDAVDLFLLCKLANDPLGEAVAAIIESIMRVSRPWPLGFYLDDRDYSTLSYCHPITDFMDLSSFSLSVLLAAFQGALACRKKLFCVF